MKKLLYISLFVLPFCLAACSGEKKPGQRINPRFDTDMSRTSEDSTIILNMTVQYLDLLKEGHFDEALGMLYTFNREDSIIQPISEERCEALRQTFANFPVLEYVIDTILMYNEFDTEVRYKYEFFEKPEDSPVPNIVNGNVCPHRYNGVWYLTVPAEKSERRNVLIRTRNNR